MARLTLVPAPMVVLFVLVQATYGEITTSSTPDRPSGTNNGAILPDKREEVERILANPPAGFNRLMAAVPISIYGKDKNNNYVAFCNTKTIDWGTVKKINPEEFTDYVKYFSLFFWKNVDGRANSSLTVVIDAKGFSVSKVVSGSVRAVLDSLVVGLNDTVAYVGERSGKVFVINTPSFLGPLLNVISKLLRTGVSLKAISTPEKWEPALREYIGEENLPVEYGGTNKTRLEDSLVLKYIKHSVRRLMKKNSAALQEKATNKSKL